MKIPLLDLKLQYLSLGEEIMEAVVRVLVSGRYILAPTYPLLNRKWQILRDKICRRCCQRHRCPSTLPRRLWNWSR